MMQAMADAGAPLEAILIAVRALEAKDGELARREREAAEKRAKDAARKREERASARLSTDCPRTVQGRGADPLPDKVSPHTPLQINPSPSPPYSPPSSRSRSAKQGSRLPDDFRMPEDWITWAMSKRGWSRAEAVEEGECFARYWQAKAGRDACKTDWLKTWQNWATNSRRPSGQGPPGNVSDFRRIAEEARLRRGTAAA